YVNSYRFSLPVASSLCDTATQYENVCPGCDSPPLTANCDSTQRLCGLSNCTIGSPSLNCSQSPPNPAKSTLPSLGCPIIAPVVLSNTASAVFTPSTYCVGPTAAFVSGGSFSI